MTSEWRESLWGDEISLEYGKALRDYNTVSGKFRVFGSNGPIGWTSQPLASGPGVILGRKGAYRGVQYSREPFFVIDTAYYVVPKTEFDMRWLYYAIKYHKLGEIDDGSPIPSTTRAAVYVRNLQIPPLSEQRVIAQVLGILDDKIELNCRINATLEAMAQALFKSWFVDFDPVKAKAAGRAPEGMDADTAALFPSEFQDSELGPIPKGWRVGAVDELFVLQRGFDLPSNNRIPGNYPILAASGPSGTHYEYKVKGPGVTTGRSGVLGNVFFVHEDFWPLNTSLWIKEYKASKPIHAYHLLKNLDVGTFNAGSAVPTLNRNHVHNLRVIIPEPRVIEHYEELVAVMFRRVYQNEKEAQTLIDLRDALLPKLISGQLRIPAGGG